VDTRHEYDVEMSRLSNNERYGTKHPCMFDLSPFKLHDETLEKGVDAKGVVAAESQPPRICCLGQANHDFHSPGTI
jgi:hypothetical protein